MLPALGALGLSMPLIRDGRGDEPLVPPEMWYYSTAMAPRDYEGPLPRLLALNDTRATKPELETALDRHIVQTKAPEGEPAGSHPPKPTTANANEDVPRVASIVGRSTPLNIPHDPTESLIAPPHVASVPQPDPIALAKRAITECHARFAHVRDYTCVFHKRERIGGRLTAPHIMTMKVRTQPTSIYFKFQKPNRGREAIYVAGRHGGRIIAHDVGLGRLVAGTMHLDPRGSMAMEDNRHPITEAGIGLLIETVAKHWARELAPEESRVAIHSHVLVSGHPCTMIESVHPRKRPDFLFHVVKLFIDHEHGLPIRFEAYDWPKLPGAAPDLVEEYTYLNLRTNVGLREEDFDPANAQYSFGRF